MRVETKPMDVDLRVPAKAWPKQSKKMRKCLKQKAMQWQRTRVLQKREQVCVDRLTEGGWMYFTDILLDRCAGKGKKRRENQVRCDGDLSVSEELPILVDIKGALQDVLIGYSRVLLGNLVSKQITFGGEWNNEYNSTRGTMRIIIIYCSWDGVED